MKRLLQTLMIALPILGFSQLWTFSSSNQDWTKKGTGAYSVATYGTTVGNLHLTVTSNHVTTNNFFVLENLVQSIPTPVTNYKFLRVKITNNTPITTMTFRADATNPSGTNKSVSITPNTSSSAEYFIDLTGIIWPGTSPSTSTATPGSAGSYELRFQKASADFWETTQYIAIDEIEFMTDIIKNDHTFDTLDNWAGETSGTNNSTVAVSGGKLIVTPGGGLNAKALNNYYSVDGSNKYVHIIYKNNSVNNNTLRVNYFSSTDGYATLKSLPDQTIVTSGNMGEVIIDASLVPTWTGNLRKISVILTNFDGTVVNPANVDTGTFEIDRIIINNVSSTLSVKENTKKFFSIYPNPTADVLSINSTSKIVGVSIYNMNGQLMKTVRSTNNQYNVSSLTKGNYLIKIYYGDGSESISKFIKK